MKNKILIVDSVNNIDWQKTLFARAGLRIFSAQTCDQALRIHREERVDVIVADLGSPEVGGDVLCRRIRSDEELQQVSVVLLCQGTPEETQWAASCGADAVIEKPYYPEALLEKVSELLAIRSRRGYRVLISTEVLTAMKGETFYSSSQNISVSGMLLETAKMLEIGTRLACSFTLPGSQKINVNGEIVRVVTFPTSGSQYYGVRFIGMEPEIRQAIEAYVGQAVVFS
jgi:DNA-binding response OmpR family regulator